MCVASERKMTKQLRKQPIRIRAKQPVEIRPGLLLPAGTYRGDWEQTCIDLVSRQWSDPTYSIELRTDEVHSGVPDEVQQDLRSIDITKAVASGEVTVGNLP